MIYILYLIVFIYQNSTRYSFCILIYLCSTAEYLNKKFVEYLVNTVEDPPCGKDDEDTLVNAFVTLILSYNQHFEGEIF